MMLKGVPDKKQSFSLMEQEIQTNSLLLRASTAVYASGTACGSYSRDGTQACCDKLDNVSSVQHENNLGVDWYWCNKDVGTGDWD